MTLGERKALVKEHLWLVGAALMRTIHRWPQGYDDLAGAGALGLVEAAERFDPTRNALFATYAQRRVRGAMLDEIRGEFGSLTQGGQQRAKALHRRWRGSVCSLELPTQEPPVWAQLEAEEFWRELRTALPARQFYALEAHYRRGLSWRVIGADLDISEQGAHYLQRRAFRVLREQWKEELR